MDKIICVGKNYVKHVAEMGYAPNEKPVFFLKPPSAMAVGRTDEVISIDLPQGRGLVHHECEIVLRLGNDLKIDAVTLGLDMTLRDVQAHQKEKGLPWEISKVFKNSAVIGPWVLLKDFPNYLDDEFSFSLDGAIRQAGRGSQMRMHPKACIEAASEYFPLCPGDMIFTGTPEGVGPVAGKQLGELCWGERLRYSVRFN